MPVPDGFERRREGELVGVVRRDVAVPLAWWWAAHPRLPSAPGRAGIATAELPDGTAVALRAYRRGGLFGAMLGDRYRDPSRSCRELRALATLRAAGVAAVEPLAAVRRGSWLRGYRHCLATVLLRDAAPLLRFVAERPALRATAARAAGAAVRRAFDAGLHHPDLHPDNLLARPSGDGVAIVLLDFDRARCCHQVSRRTRDRMLLRMARYLAKHAASLPARVRPVDVCRFLAGHGLDRAERRALLDRLAPGYRRALRRYARRAR